jgi:bifunctional polynucleotide phosphatase/kinase
MKKHSKMQKNTKPKDLEKKSDTSSEIMSNIMKDYDSVQDKKEEEKIDIFKWQTLENTVLCKAFNNFLPGKKKLLSFDLDDTLITFGKSGKSKSPNKTKDTPYKFTFDLNKVKSKLDEYQKNDFIVAIFSNQNGITQGHIKESDFKDKIDKIFSQELKYPIITFFAKEKDFYRKPCVGMFDLFTKKFNENAPLDLSECIYVGDAAGRKKSSTYKRNDFSNSDYKFALNCGLKFFTPEEFFLGEKSPYPTINNTLHDLDKNNNDHIKYDISSNHKEAIIFIGSPGSGKSNFCENNLTPKGYVRINQDTLKTRQKVIKCLEENLKAGNKVVIDSTNPEKNGRKEYIKICKNYGYYVRAFNFLVSKDLAMHLNNLRTINKNRKHLSGYVNAIPIHTFFKNYEEPNKTEGFNEIVKVNFIPGPFENEEDKKIFYYLS